MTQAAPSPEEIQQQAGKILTQVAGYIGVRTIDIGLRMGLFEELAAHPEGMTVEALAKQKSLDAYYTQVWCRSAYASEVLELEGESYKLAPHMDKLLLNLDFPGYAGGLPGIMGQPEMFDMFSQNLPTGKRIWWDECSPEFIEAVSLTARPFYVRSIPGGLSKVPGLSDKLAQGGKILELGCGVGVGLLRMAEAFPNCALVGLDGDSYTLKLVGERLEKEGLKDRASLVHSMFEELDHSDEYDMVYINVSMHECRDIDKVTANVQRALKPGGYFVISDFPFPDTTEGCRTVPARLMCGIQFFEAQIGDQLLPTQAYIDLLGKHGFQNVAAFDLAPVHAITHGQK